MNYNQKGIPAFGGVVSKGTASIASHPLVKSVYSNQNLNLYIFNTEEKNGYFSLSENALIWFGGKRNSCNSKLLDIHNNDDKFVLLKFGNQSLQLYTDHYSKIPLFYIKAKDKLIFSTSIQLLLLLNPEGNLSFSDTGILFYYNFGFADYENFLIEGVNSVPGGKELTYNFDSGDLVEKSYYDIFDLSHYQNNTNSFEQNVKQIDEVLLDSTKRILDDYNAIGIALSGGVDSGYLAQKINECGRDFKAYTLGFDNDYNEFERIEYLGKKLDFSVQKIIVGPEDIIQNYLQVVKHSSFPVGFNNSILNFIYQDASTDGIDLMFDGDGADRLFLGMNKYVQLQKILKYYKTSKNFGLHKLFTGLLNIIGHPTSRKLGFYFQKFNEGIPFYGERKLSNNQKFVKQYEQIINDLALPKEMKSLGNSIEDWLFFTLFSVYYTPGFFFHTPYELQLQKGIVSNPQFWSDDMVNLALSIPVDQKLADGTTKKVLREAAKLKIDDGYWGLSKIGLQNSYLYMKDSDQGKVFINDHLSDISNSDAYKYLTEKVPQSTIDAERLLPYHLWKKSFIE